MLDAWGWCTGMTQRDGMGRGEIHRTGALEGPKAYLYPRVTLSKSFNLVGLNSLVFAGAALLWPIQYPEAGHAGAPGPGATGAAEGVGP